MYVVFGSVLVCLIIFAAVSLLVFIFRVGYLIHVGDCTPIAEVVSPFVEAPFLGLQVRNCIHRNS